MHTYTLHNEFALSIVVEDNKILNSLEDLLKALSFKPVKEAPDLPTLHWQFFKKTKSIVIPENAIRLLQSEGFSVTTWNNDFFVSDGYSYLHLQPNKKQGLAFLDDSIFCHPLLVIKKFLGYGLMKLIQSLGYFTLHGASLESPAGKGVVISGPSGCGKTTLTLGLMKNGWKYLSDDAILLKQKEREVKVFSLRKSFYIDASRTSHYSDFILGGVSPDSEHNARRELKIHASHARQYVPHTRPDTLLFPQIIDNKQSTVELLKPSTVFRLLIAESGGQLFDKKSLPKQIKTLKNLIHQTKCYTLNGASDLEQDPSKSSRILATQGI